MAKSKLNQDEHYESEDKLLLLANTSCLTGSKSAEKSKFDPNKSKSISSNEKKSLTPSTSSREQEDNEKKNNQAKNKSSTPSTSSVPTASASAAQQNSNKSRNKQLQSVRGRLEQQLKALKKKTDSKNFNFAYRKTPSISQPSQTKTNLTGSTKSSTSTANSSTSQSTCSIDTITTSTSSISTNKETVVSNCLKNDCILYPNSNKNTKDALLNKFKNVSSTSLDTSFHKEDSSNDSLGKLEIDTNLESLNDKLKEKSPKTSKQDKSSKKDSDAILNSPNKNLYECESNSAKLLPMSYSIEKLASSTSINQQLEPAPPSTFISSFDSSLNSDLTGPKFGDKLKLQSDLFPNLHRYGTGGLSNWSNAFSKDKQLSSPSFNYSSTTPVFGAFSRTASTSFGSPTFASLNSNLTANKTDAAITESDKKKKEIEKDYYSSTEDETDDQAISKDKLGANDDDTDVQTDLDDQEMDENVKRIINEQLMKNDDEDDDDNDEIIVSDKKSKTKKKGKAESKKVIEKKVEKKVEKKTEKKTPTKASTSKQTKVNQNDNKEQTQQKGSKRAKNAKQTGKANKKSKKAIEEEEEEEQLTEEEPIEIKPTKPVKSTKATKATTTTTKGKNEKSKQPAKASSTAKNRTSLNASTIPKTTPTKKDAKQVKKTTPTIKPKGKATAGKNKNKSAKTTSPIVSNEGKRKSEVDRLLDQSSDRSTDFMFNESIYETIADKVKVGRKSKLAAASALQLSSLPTKQLENLISPKQTPTKKQATKASSTKAVKKTTASKKIVPKDEETDLDSDDDETNVDDADSLFEEPSSTKKSTSKGNVGKKRKLKAETTKTANKRKSGRGKSGK